MKMSGRGRPCIEWIVQCKRYIETRGQDWRTVDEMQEWADRDSWRLLCESRLTDVETTHRRNQLTSWLSHTVNQLTISWSHTDLWYHNTIPTETVPYRYTKCRRNFSHHQVFQILYIAVNFEMSSYFLRQKTVCEFFDTDIPILLMVLN
jgi:hypothetical protein